MASDSAVKFHALRVTNRARFSREVNRRKQVLGESFTTRDTIEHFPEFDSTVVITYNGWLRIYPGLAQMIEDEVLDMGGEPVNPVTDIPFERTTNLYDELVKASH